MISISLSSRLSSSQLPKHQRTLPGSFQILPSCGVPHHTTAISPVAQVLHGVLKILLLACADQWVPKFQFTLSLFLERINQRENHGNTLKQMECFMFTSNWLTDRHCFFSIFPVSSDQSSEIECHKIQQNKVCLQLSMVKHKHVGTSCSACHGSSPASFRSNTAAAQTRKWAKLRSHNGQKQNRKCNRGVCCKTLVHPLLAGLLAALGKASPFEGSCQKHPEGNLSDSPTVL